MTDKPQFVGKKVRLGDIVKIEKASMPSGNNVWVLNLDAVEKGTGKVIVKNRMKADSAGTSTVAFTADAVLYSKLRPNLNKVVVADEPGLATSEMLPLIVNPEVLDRRYFAYLLRSNSFVNLAVSSTAGSKMPRMNKKTLLNAVFPIPSLELQHQRIDLLSSIEKARTKAELLIQQLDTLVKSRFIEMFGDLKQGYSCSSCRLGSISRIGSSRRVFRNELLSEGIPFYRGTEIAALSMGSETSPSLFISKERYDELVAITGKPEVGDLLLPSICPDGQIWRVDTGKPFYFKDGRVLWIHPNREIVDSIFLRHALSILFQMSFSDIASGTTFAEMKIFLLKELEVPLPDITVQKKFAAFVAQVDKSRFIEMFGDPVEENRWARITLASLCTKLGSGATPRGGKAAYKTSGIPLIRSMNVHNGYFESKDLAYIDEIQAKKLDNVTLHKGDVLLNITGASVARSCLLPDYLAGGRVNQHVSIVRCDPNRMLPRVLNSIFTSDSYQRFLLEHSRMAGATREAITKDDLETMTVPLPPLSLQYKFAAFVAQVDKSRFGGMLHLLNSLSGIMHASFFSVADTD